MKGGQGAKQLGKTGILLFEYATNGEFSFFPSIRQHEWNNYSNSIEITDYLTLFISHSLLVPTTIKWWNFYEFF